MSINLSNGKGFSIKEVINMVEKVTKRKIPTTEAPRRFGDPPILVGKSDRANKILGWFPQYPDLEDIITHAWNWHQKLENRNFASKTVD